MRQAKHICACMLHVCCGYVLRLARCRASCLLWVRIGVTCRGRAQPAKVTVGSQGRFAWAALPWPVVTLHVCGLTSCFAKCYSAELGYFAKCVCVCVCRAMQAAGIEPAPSRHEPGDSTIDTAPTTTHYTRASTNGTSQVPRLSLWPSRSLTGQDRYDGYSTHKRTAHGFTRPEAPPCLHLACMRACVWSPGYGASCLSNTALAFIADQGIEGRAGLVAKETVWSDQKRTGLVYRPGSW